MATTRVSDGLSKRDFPEGFIFGASSASYQYEGGYNEDGKGPSIWDTYTHKFPEKILDRSNGDVAVNSYHLYKEDVKMLTNMGMNGYRFSISWPRILPNGKLSGGVNEKGVAYYNNLINHLLENGITPFVTLFHWDLPQALEDEYEGFLSPNIVNDFKDYAEVCFNAFGDRVKHWTTLNEPRTFAVGGYVTGHLAPSKTSNSGIDPYLVTHYQLLAHAAAVKLYRDKYQQGQEGKIGIALNTFWMAPTNKHKDKEAAQRALDFMYGWYMDPLVHGDYPKCMRELVKDRLPKFKEDEVMLLKGSYDFIGLNYYTSDFVEDCSPPPDAKPCYSTDSHTTLEGKRNGIPIGRPTASGWLYVYPLGFYDLLRYTKHHYNNPVIYITENGMSRPNDPKLPLEEALDDEYRIAYYDHHLFYLHKAMKEGANVKGYLPWSLLDNFEWSSGFTVRFGLNYVDYNDGFKRYPKKSAEWFKNLLNK